MKDKVIDKIFKEEIECEVIVDVERTIERCYSIIDDVFNKHQNHYTVDTIKRAERFLIEHYKESLDYEKKNF